MHYENIIKNNDCATTKTIIELRNIKKSFNKEPIVENLNLKIENLGRASDLQNAKFLLPDFFIYVSECYTVASVSDRH